MGFQLAYGEAPVLDTALFMAIREWRKRLDDPFMASIREETEIQIKIAEHMQARLRSE